MSSSCLSVVLCIYLYIYEEPYYAPMLSVHNVHAVWTLSQEQKLIETASLADAFLRMTDCILLQNYFRLWNCKLYQNQLRSVKVSDRTWTTVYKGNSVLSLFLSLIHDVLILG